MTHIDLQQIARNKFRFLSNKLAFIGPYLRLGRKIKHQGFELWLEVEAGNPKAQRKMERYCRQDVNLTERLYGVMKEYIHNHPTFKKRFHNCGDEFCEKRGFRYTRAMKIQRLFCKKCRGWYDGAKEKLV